MRPGSAGRTVLLTRTPARCAAARDQGMTGVNGVFSCLLGGRGCTHWTRAPEGEGIVAFCLAASLACFQGRGRRRRRKQSRGQQTRRTRLRAGRPKGSINRRAEPVEQRLATLECDALEGVGRIAIQGEKRGAPVVPDALLAEPRHGGYGGLSVRFDADCSAFVDEARPALDSRERPFRVLENARSAMLLLSLLALIACGTKTLKMPPPESVGSPTGPMVEVSDVTDERVTPTLGKIDSLTIDSGPDLLKYVEAELINSLFRMGFDVRQVDQSEPPAGQKRVRAALLSAELESESTLLDPVEAAVRLRVELTDELGEVTFRRDVRGALSRDLGMHTQGGREDAELLAEVIGQTLAALAADKSFVAAVSMSPDEAQRRRKSEQEIRETDRDAGSRAPLPKEAEEMPARGSKEVAEERLRTLDQLLEEGLIDRDDYAKKRREILSDL